MWTQLNADGRKFWGDIFPKGKVPVLGMSFQNVLLKNMPEKICLVNLKLLSKDQKQKIFAKLAERFGAPVAEVEASVKKNGLPLRARFTTGVIFAELRWFI